MTRRTIGRPRAWTFVVGGNWELRDRPWFRGGDLALLWRVYP